MGRIVVDIDDQLASAWQTTSTQKKEEAIRYFQLIVKRILNEDIKKDFDQLMKELRDDAKVNGLTPEILEELLNEA